MRPLNSADFPSVAQIAFCTGYFGQPAAVYLPDEKLFADLWVQPYFVSSPFGMAAERDGQLLGYIIGTPTWTEYRLAFARVLAQVVRRAACGEYTRPVATLPYLTRAVRFPNAHAPEALYPAHFHLNVRRESRGFGIGDALLNAYLEALAVRGAPGVQLSTTLENRAALALYHKHHLRIWSERVSPLWQPWLGRQATHVVMTRTLGHRS